MPGPAYKEKLKVVWSLLRKTVDEYSRDRADLLGAALAFYTLLSLAPLIIVAVAIAGAVLGRGAAREEITRLMSESMGMNAAETVNGWVDEASRSGGVASVIGVGLLLFTASRLVAQLRSALNQIWNVDEVSADGFKASVTGELRRRAFAFALVVASGPVLLLIFASRALLTGLHQVLFEESPLAGLVVQVTQISFSVGVVAIMTAVVFKIVPDVRVDWKSVWVGALLTSVLFNLGNVAVGFYLGRATIAATYGAAGSAVVLLLWLSFSAQIFLLGAEFTQVYASHFDPIVKRENALQEAAAAQLTRKSDGSDDSPGSAPAADPGTSTTPDDTPNSELGVHTEVAGNHQHPAS